MTILINSYNTLSAGTSTITKAVLNRLQSETLSEPIYLFIPQLRSFQEFQSKGRLHIIKIPIPPGPLKYAFRALYDFLLFPLATVFLKADLSVIFANYAPMKLKGRKVVLMRHSYLIDDSIYNSAPLKTRLTERLRRFFFKLTLRSTEAVLVQSSYMKTLLLKKYSIPEDRVHVLPNPMTEVAELKHAADSPPEKTTEHIILYVSRYYPHKNHNLLLEIARDHQAVMRKENMKFYITVNPSLGNEASLFLDRISACGLEDLIVNIGEVENRALAEYYRKATCLFFPSDSETFGNPLVEAMHYGLPVVVPDHPYSVAVCEQAGLYYAPRDSAGAFALIHRLCREHTVRTDFSKKSLQQALKFPTMTHWLNRLFAFHPRQGTQL